MLNFLKSDLPSFKTVKFHQGLNLIIADKSIVSGDRKTRNGAGKTSLVELINSLLGGDLNKDSLMRVDALKEYSFYLNLDVSDNRLQISRTGSVPSKVQVHIDEKGVLPVIEDDGKLYISNEQWTEFLGKNIFGLSFANTPQKYSASFRMLFSYFARGSKGFDSPEKTFPQQARWQFQVAISYLLKLNWKLVREFESIRQKDKLVKALIKASNEGALKEVIGSTSELTTEIHLNNSRLLKLKESLSTFKVLPEYREKEQRVNVITSELSSLSADDITDNEWLTNLEETFEKEEEPDTSRVLRLFDEASSILNEVVSKKFDEFEAFHNSIIQNRKSHLADEIEILKERIDKRNAKKVALDNERSEILSLLHSHGALDQFYKLQNEATKLEAKLEVLNQKLIATKDLDVQKADLKIDKSKLQKKVITDHTERDKAIEQAIIVFGDISNELYDEPGKFKIQPTDDGPKFEFDIPGKKSTGKSKMQIFCFDLMMMKLWANEPVRPKLLVHDSKLFDGVDERQVARALNLGAAWAKKYGFQYIVTLNSDDLPDMSEFQDFTLSDHVVDLHLTDTETGGLFGFRF